MGRDFIDLTESPVKGKQVIRACVVLPSCGLPLNKGGSDRMRRLRIEEFKRSSGSPSNEASRSVISDERGDAGIDGEENKSTNMTKWSTYSSPPLLANITSLQESQTGA